MQRALSRNIRAIAAVAASALIGCADAPSITDLHTEGPPMIEQVRLVEVYTANEVKLTRTVFGFGSHPQAGAEDAHAVTSAKATDNKLRVVLDELVRGNDLEEIGCRANVDDDSYDRVPVGATPDDVARCAVAQDVLPSSCPGSNRLSLCLCRLDAGCPTGTGRAVIAKGESVGVLDIDQDGAADKTRFLLGAAGITCGAIDVPIDLDRSYWTPSGNQQRPALGGFDALGPAVVIVPLGALPAGQTCGLRFSPDVVDKDGNGVCAPPDGDVEATCTPGDTGAVMFRVEPIELALVAALLDPGQPRTADITIRANVPLDAASLAGITVTEGASTRYTAFTARLAQPNQIAIHWTADGGLAPATRYTIAVAVTDTYQQPARPLQVAFTTGAN
jgi:hypothetical protein